MSEAKPDGGLRIFGLMWFGQLVSLVGSSLTRFALGVWVFERTGSATQFALITLFARSSTDRARRSGRSKCRRTSRGVSSRCAG